MNLNLADYLKLKNIEPGSEDAVHMGCTCTQKTGKESGQKTVTIDPYCPFHWHVALQAQSLEMFERVQKTEEFNSALKFGYIVLGIGMAAIVIWKL